MSIGSFDASAPTPLISDVDVLDRMVEKNAAKRPSATEALSFPVVNQKLKVQLCCAVMLMM